jgi:hypothetical protein
VTAETTCPDCAFWKDKLKEARDEAARLATSNRLYARANERLVNQNLQLCNTLEFWERRRTGKAS